MSRISKRKLIKALKGELEVKPTNDEIFERFKNPPTQEEWLKGYHKWIQEHTLSTPLDQQCEPDLDKNTFHSSGGALYIEPLFCGDMRTLYTLQRGIQKMADINLHVSVQAQDHLEINPKHLVQI